MISNLSNSSFGSLLKPFETNDIKKYENAVELTKKIDDNQSKNKAL